MIKTLSSFLLLTAVILFSNCSSSKNIEYEIYQGLKPEDREFIMSMVEPGAELYKTSCSECHGIFGRGKAEVTNFSEEQLHDYKSAFIMGDPENHAVSDNLTAHELDQILMFLMFLKRD